MVAGAMYLVVVVSVGESLGVVVAGDFDVV